MTTMRLPPPGPEIGPREKANLLRRYLDAGESVAGLDFSGADLRSARLKHADLTGARLRGAILHRARLANAVLDGCDLQLADLGRAHLEHASLRGASLSHADLSYAAMNGADLSGADLRGARLDGAELDTAAVDRGTFERSGWTPNVLQRLVDRGVRPVDLSEIVLGEGRGRGLTLTFDTRLHRFDPTAIDALIAQVLGPDTDVTIEERSNIDTEGPASIRINGSRPGDLLAVAEAFYERAWRSAQAVAEERALQRASSSHIAGLLLRRLDELRDHMSEVRANVSILGEPGVRDAMADQADSYALVKHVATRRVEELNAALGQERDARRALEELVAGLFAPGALHPWVGSRLGSAVADALPGPTATHAEVVAELVAVLERRGLVDGRLFEMLVAWRPEAEEAIWAVAGRWGLTRT